MSSNSLSPYPSSHPPLSPTDISYLRKCFSLKSGMSKSPLHSAFRVFSIITFTLPSKKPNQPQPIVESIDHPYYSHGRTRFQYDSENISSDFSVPPFCLRLDSPVHSVDSSPVYFVTGTNVELCLTGCTFCAERSALALLRQVDFERILSVYIVSDLDSELEPGLLCREFLLNFISPLTPIILASKSKNIPDGELEFSYRFVYLKNLFPHPALFMNISAPFLPVWAAEFLKSSENLSQNEFSQSLSSLKSIASPDRIFSLFTSARSFIAFDDRDWVNSIRLAAAILFSDGSEYSAHQTKLAEYGYSLDPITKAVAEIEHRKRNSIFPVLIIQVDQFGIFHSPFAAARAHITEMGEGKCLSIIHDSDGKLIVRSFADYVPGNITDDLKNALEQRQNNFK